MSFVVPHLFSEVLGAVVPAPVRPTLLLGAGMSFSLVPLPRELVQRLAPLQKRTEAALGISPCLPLDPTNNRALYVWAGEVFEKLRKNGVPDREAKYAIAGVLGVTKDCCWSARAKVPIRGTTERHRVIARLAREGRWYSLWSLNWDLWLERALLSVGIERSRERPSEPSILPDSWIRWYQSWTPSLPLTGLDAQTVVLYKPHGCVEALERGSGTFVLTEQELAAQLESQPRPVLDEMQECFKNHSFVASGWSASEPYLQEFFSVGAKARISTASLTIIDTFPNSKGHRVLEDAYGCTAADAVFHTGVKEFPTTDDLFLWMQTRHGLSCLSEVCDKAYSTDFGQWLELFARPVHKTEEHSFMNDWFDSFLAVWSRLCFNNGHQIFYQGRAVAKIALPTKRRDEHIPWSDQRSPRLDLMAASTLLRHMFTSKTNMHMWCSKTFPGALWNASKQQLVLPVPAWRNDGNQSLASLKPLVESRHWGYQGLIRDVAILGLTHNPNAAEVSQAEKDNWIYEFSRLMRFGKLARPAKIGWLRLVDWKV